MRCDCSSMPRTAVSTHWGWDKTVAILQTTFLDAFSWMKMYEFHLTPKHWETHGCVVSTVATDALVLKHQAISIHNADQIFIVLDQFHIRILHLWCTTLENKITFWKKWLSRLRVKIPVKFVPNALVSDKQCQWKRPQGLTLYMCSFAVFHKLWYPICTYWMWNYEKSFVKIMFYFLSVTTLIHVSYAPSCYLSGITSTAILSNE